MRIFKTYAPMQIAKYVRTFFRGEFTIQGLGVFRFEGGRIVGDQRQDATLRQITREVNALIMRMRGALQASPVDCT